jgi:hypothetical protein
MYRAGSSTIQAKREIPPVVKSLIKEEKNLGVKNAEYIIEEKDIGSSR